MEVKLKHVCKYNQPAKECWGKLAYVAKSDTFTSLTLNKHQHYRKIYRCSLLYGKWTGSYISLFYSTGALTALYLTCFLHIHIRASTFFYVWMLSIYHTVMNTFGPTVCSACCPKIVWYAGCSSQRSTNLSIAARSNSLTTATPISSYNFVDW